MLIIVIEDPPLKLKNELLEGEVVRVTEALFGVYVGSVTY